jgi:hypothetical protein
MDRELDLRLKEIRGRISQADPLLVRLLNFATHFANPFQYGLVLILDGVTVMGTPGPSTSTGEILDRQTVRYFRSMQAMDISVGRDGRGWRETVEWFEQNPLFYSQAKRADEAQAKVYEKMGSAVINDLTELLDRPDNLADEAVEAFIPPKAFTLINASMLQVNSNTWQSVPNMRVSISAVRAWWTFDLGVPDQVKEILAQLEAEADG